MAVEKKNLNKSERKSNIELLRVLAMILIVAHHVAVHSDFGFPTDLITFNKLWIQFIELGGKIGVNIFVLISGYFGVVARSIKPQKAIKLWLQIFTYSVVFFLISLKFLGEAFSLKTMIKDFLPITYSNWWFASTYFVLYLLSPFLNRFLNSLDKKDYLKFLCVLAIFWSIIPTFLARSWGSSELLWFIFLYSCSGYIRLHVNINKFKSKYFFFPTALLIILTYLSAVVFDILGLGFSFFANRETYLYAMEKLPILLISLMMFCGFLLLKINHNSIINLISSATFGVYLIHDNHHVRDFLWVTLFKNNSYSNSNFLALYTLLEILIVYFVAMVVELIRIHLIERIYVNYIDRFVGFAKKVVVKIDSLKVVNNMKTFFELQSEPNEK